MSRSDHYVDLFHSSSKFKLLVTSQMHLRIKNNSPLLDYVLFLMMMTLKLSNLSDVNVDYMHI